MKCWRTSHGERACAVLRHCHFKAARQRARVPAGDITVFLTVGHSGKRFAGRGQPPPFPGRGTGASRTCLSAPTGERLLGGSVLS